MAQQLTQAVVEEWVALTHGRITNKDAWAELDIGTPTGRKHLRVIMSRLIEKNILRARSDGNYERVNGSCPAIDWQAADLTNVVDLAFPFGLEEYATIYPKSIIVVAGSKNVGKTAFLYNFIWLNCGKHIIDLYNSETGPEQMKQRFTAFPEMPDIAPFNTFERYDNFSEVIHPDHVSVIDYLDMNSEVYLAGSEIDAMFRKLKTGVVVVAMQKPPPTVTMFRGKKLLTDRDLAYGGAFTAKRAVLYISLSDQRLKLVYVKTPRNPAVKPDNMQWSFNIAGDGVTFQNIKPYSEPGQEDPPWYQS